MSAKIKAEIVGLYIASGFYDTIWVLVAIPLGILSCAGDKFESSSCLHRKIKKLKEKDHETKHPSESHENEKSNQVEADSKKHSFFKSHFSCHKKP